MSSASAGARGLQVYVRWKAGNGLVRPKLLLPLWQHCVHYGFQGCEHSGAKTVSCCPRFRAGYPTQNHHTVLPLKSLRVLFTVLDLFFVYFKHFAAEMLHLAFLLNYQTCNVYIYFFSFFHWEVYESVLLIEHLLVTVKNLFSLPPFSVSPSEVRAWAKQ